VSGSPLRPDRASFGPTVVNTTPVRDRTRQIGADIANLIMWQLAGMGLTGPRSVLHFTAQVGPLLLGRAESWNPERLSVGAHADPTITRTAAGNYLVSYPTPVPDENGDEQVISFSWAHAFVVNSNPLVLKHAQAAVEASTNQLRVGVFSSAAALEDGNQVVLLGW